MATNVSNAFEEFLSDLQATQAETSVAASHRTSIYNKLRESFGITAFFRTGSFGNGTNISGYSDVDYFAVIPTANLKADSSKTLAAVAVALRERFPLTANIRVNGPGVQIPFGLDGAEHTEVVPVDRTGTTRLGFRQFDIADGLGGWKFSAPESHNAYVEAIDQKHGGRVKPLIQFVKAWKYYRNAPIKSFYLELFVARYADGEAAIIYDIDVRNILSQLSTDELPSFFDPRFPNDGFIISACNTEVQRQDALSKISNAAKWADGAVNARLAERSKAAFDLWDLVYDYNFPVYTGS